MTMDELDEYLWDRTGEGDEQLRRLETLLARFRYERPVPEWPKDGEDENAEN